MTTSRGLAVLVLSIAALLWFGGCTSSPAGPHDVASEEAGSNPAADQTHDPEIAQRLALMQEAIDRGTPGSDNQTARGETRTDFWQPVDVEDRPQARADTTTPAVEADGVSTARPRPDVSPTTQSAPPPSTAEQIRSGVATLASSLRTRGEETGHALPSWIRIGALETIEPGVLNAYYSTNATGGPASSLSRPEHDFLVAWRDLHTRVWEEADAGDIAGLAEVVDEAARRIDALRPLSIAQAKLCDRVERYGVYDERRSYDDVHKLLAGKSQRLLLYLELEHFSHREAFVNGADGHSVDLTVGLSLHHLGREKDLLAWRMADEKVSVFSRNERREFFLTIIADLPETISIDAYALKARVTDENSGSVAEKIIRIDVVADPSALTADAR